MKDFLTDEEMAQLESGGGQTSDFLTDEQMAQLEASTKEPEKKSIGGFLGNTVKSAGNFIGGLATAVAHPVQTVKTLGQLGLGAIDNVAQMNDKFIDRLPVGDTAKKVLNTGMDMINPITAIPTLARGVGFDKIVDDSNALADMVGQEYKDRYGGWQNIKDTAYNDPVGVLADLSTVLSGGAGVATKVGKVAQVGGKAGQLSRVAEAGRIAEQTGNILSKASRVTDPLNYALKGGSKVASFAVKKGATPVNLALKGIGLTTGRGGDTFRQIWEASKAGRTGAVTAMRGGADQETLINSLDNANNALRNLANEEWTKLGLDDMSKSLDISPVIKKLDSELKTRNILVDADGNLDFSRSTVGKTSDQNDIVNIYNDVKSWGTKTGDRTPRGIDTLKQRIGSYYDPKSVARSFVESMRKEARGILSQVDGYDEYAKNYGEIMDSINQLKNEMRVGSANPQTTWNKIVNTFKQRNTEARQAIVKKLQEDGISDIADEIAGYTAKDVFPSDIIRGGAGFYALPGIGSINPLLLPTLSPRVMGEVVNFIGKNTGRAERFANFLKETTKNGTQKVPASKIIQYIGGQVYNKNKATRSSTLQQRLEEAQEEDD